MFKYWNQRTSATCAFHTHHHRRHRHISNSGSHQRRKKKWPIGLEHWPLAPPAGKRWTAAVHFVHLLLVGDKLMIVHVDSRYSLLDRAAKLEPFKACITLMVASFSSSSRLPSRPDVACDLEFVYQFLLDLKGVDAPR